MKIISIFKSPLRFIGLALGSIFLIGLIGQAVVALAVPVVIFFVGEWIRKRTNDNLGKKVETSLYIIVYGLVFVYAVFFIDYGTY